MQARARGEIASLGEMRAVVRACGGVAQFDPHGESAWGEARARFERLMAHTVV